MRGKYDPGMYVSTGAYLTTGLFLDPYKDAENSREPDSEIMSYLCHYCGNSYEKWPISGCLGCSGRRFHFVVHKIKREE